MYVGVIFAARFATVLVNSLFASLADDVDGKFDQLVFQPESLAQSPISDDDNRR